MSNIKVGDVVRLRSGGPEMTVQAKAESAKVEAVACVWFPQTNSCEPMRHNFSVDTLEKVR